jgi:hypothetical protein
MGKNLDKPIEKNKRQLTALPQRRGALTAVEFRELPRVPSEAEWFANIENPHKRRAYRIDIHEFMQFVSVH